MSSIKNIINQRFGRLVALEIVGRNLDRRVLWRCRCDCGNECIVSGKSLRGTNTSSCGCLHRETSQKIGKLNRGRPCSENFKREHSLRMMGHKVSEETKEKISFSRLGEKHWRWRKDLTTEERKNGRSYDLELYDWRKKICRLCHYRCIVCDSISLSKNPIVAHHLNGWEIFKEERYNLNNGVTLCRKCHISFHKELGFGDNTKEQFLKWYTKS